MESHPALGIMLWILFWFSPTSPDPCLLHHQVFRSVLIRLSHCCLHSSPSCSSPSQAPHPSRSGSNSRSLKNGLLCCLPPSAFPAHPHTYSVSSCAGSVGVLSHPCLSVHTCPSVPEPGNSVPGHTRWKMGPAIPSCSSRGRLCPLSSHSPQWVHLTINESLQPPLSCECRKAPQPSAGPLHLLCLLTGCVPTWSQGSCVSTSKIAAPLAFPTEHTSQPQYCISLYSVSVFALMWCKVLSAFLTCDVGQMSGTSVNLC